MLWSHREPAQAASGEDHRLAQRGVEPGTLRSGMACGPSRRHAGSRGHPRRVPSTILPRGTFSIHAVRAKCRHGGMCQPLLHALQPVPSHLNHMVTGLCAAQPRPISTSPPGQVEIRRASRPAADSLHLNHQATGPCPAQPRPISTSPPGQVEIRRASRPAADSFTPKPPGNRPLPRSTPADFHFAPRPSRNPPYFTSRSRFLRTSTTRQQAPAPLNPGRFPLRPQAKSKSAVLHAPQPIPSHLNHQATGPCPAQPRPISTSPPGQVEIRRASRPAAGSFTPKPPAEAAPLDSSTADPAKCPSPRGAPPTPHAWRESPPPARAASPPRRGRCPPATCAG